MKNMVFLAFATMFLCNSCYNAGAGIIASESRIPYEDALDPVDYDFIGVEYYYVLDGVDAASLGVVKSAITHMVDKIWCLYLTEYDPAQHKENINKNMILHFVSVSALPSPVVGLRIEGLGTKMLFLSNNGHDKKGALEPLDDEYKFKVILHELAHGLGMNDHPFEREDAEMTLLSPVIASNSKAYLVPKDVEYITNMVCK